MAAATATSTATLTANLAQDLCATTIKKPTERTRPFFCGIRVQLEFYIDYGVLAKNEIYFVPPLPSFPLPLSQTNPPLSVQAAVAATTPAKEPSQGALETFCRALFSSSSNSLCIYMLYRIGIGTEIGIALRLSSALCYVALWRGEKGTRVPFCCLLRFWIRLWFWLVARPTTFWFSVCSKMHLAGYIFGWLFVSCCLPACDCIVISMVHMPMWQMPLCGIDAMHRQLCGKDISNNTAQHSAAQTNVAGWSRARSTSTPN